MSTAEQQPVSVADEFDDLWECLHILPDDSIDFALARFMRDKRNLIAESLRLHARIAHPDQTTLDRVCRAYERNRNNRSGLDAPRAVLAELLEVARNAER